MKSFLKSLREIYEGWRNDMFPTPELRSMAEKRANICASCPLNKGNVCSKLFSAPAVDNFVYKEEFRIKGRVYPGCGCPLSKKTISPDSKCPIGKW